MLGPEIKYELADDPKHKFLVRKTTIFLTSVLVHHEDQVVCGNGLTAYPRMVHSIHQDKGKCGPRSISQHKENSFVGGKRGDRPYNTEAC